MPRALFCSLLLLCLAGCGGNPPAPVEDRNYPADSSRPLVLQRGGSLGSGHYAVKRGDTLYSIAWRQGLDFRALAAANKIPAPYTIYPGQILQLREGALPSSGKVAAKKPVAKAQPKPSTTTQKTAPPPSTVPEEKPLKPSPARTALPPRAPVSAWRWPSSGKVVRGFSASLHKGIDIAGTRGEPVEAVADGVVVYAGTGIAGFGELLIVKHNDTYLSAYGHNERLLVPEGATVRAGQKIAEKGNTGTDSVKLHFEIRKEGRPVDPLRLLPKR